MRSLNLVRDLGSASVNQHRYLYKLLLCHYAVYYCRSEKMNCEICNKLIDFDDKSSYNKLTERGCTTINNATKALNADVHEIVYSNSKSLYVHSKCRS